MPKCAPRDARGGPKGGGVGGEQQRRRGRVARVPHAAAAVEGRRQQHVGEERVEVDERDGLRVAHKHRNKEPQLLGLGGQAARLILSIQKSHKH